MRKNTGTRTVQTTIFVYDASGQGRGKLASGTSTWTPAQVDRLEDHLAGYRQTHLELNEDEHGAELDVQVWEYEVPGLKVYAFVNEGTVELLITVEDDDLARVHTALITGRELSIRYVKADGEVTRRRVQPQSLRFTKAGDAIIRAADNRRDGDTRSFRWDRITHTTLHRAVRRPAPTKSALWAEFERTLPAAPAPVEARPVEGQVRHTRRDYTGVVVEGSRAFSASGWSVTVKLDSEYAQLTPGGTVRASEDELEARGTAVTDVYLTDPGTAVALEAPEEVQDVLAERYALGHEYAFITA